VCYSPYYLLYAQQTNLSFENLELFVQTNSPQIKLIEKKYQLDDSERRIDLQWTNPDFNFEYENVKNDFSSEKEMVFTLNKTFELPWTYSKRKDYWESKLAASELGRKERYNFFIAYMKSGYVELKMLENQQLQANKIKTILTTISQTANDQHTEGAISGLDQSLIQMALFNVESAILKLTEQALSLESEWKSLAGIKNEDLINLNSEIFFKKINFDLLSEIALNQNNYITLQTRFLKQKSLQNNLELEEMNWLPQFSIGGGYKSVNQDLTGFVLQFSLPLPVLNQNSPQIQKSKIELETFNYDFLQYRNQISGKVNVLSRVIRAHESVLEKLNSAGSKPIDQLDQIISSYEEGWTSLNDLLNSLSIYFDFIQSSSEQLIHYYLSVFELEALSGKSLVSF